MAGSMQQTSDFLQVVQIKKTRSCLGKSFISHEPLYSDGSCDFSLASRRAKWLADGANRTRMWARKDAALSLSDSFVTEHKHAQRALQLCFLSICVPKYFFFCSSLRIASLEENEMSNHQFCWGLFFFFICFKIALVVVVVVVLTNSCAMNIQTHSECEPQV